MIEVDPMQIIGEVKERNRFYTTITGIREKAVSVCDDNVGMPSKYKKHFMQIIYECDKALEGVI